VPRMDSMSITTKSAINPTNDAAMGKSLGQNGESSQERSRASYWNHQNSFALPDLVTIPLINTQRNFRIENKANITGRRSSNSPERAAELTKLLPPTDYRTLEQGVASSIVNTRDQDAVQKSYLDRQSLQLSRVGKPGLATNATSSLDEVHGESALADLIDNNYATLSHRNKMQRIHNQKKISVQLKQLARDQLSRIDGA